MRKPATSLPSAAASQATLQRPSAKLRRRWQQHVRVKQLQQQRAVWTPGIAAEWLRVLCLTSPLHCMARLSLRHPSHLWSCTCQMLRRWPGASKSCAGVACDQRALLQSHLTCARCLSLILHADGAAGLVYTHVRPTAALAPAQCITHGMRSEPVPWCVAVCKHTGRIYCNMHAMFAFLCNM